MNYHPIIDRLKRIAELLPTAITERKNLLTMNDGLINKRFNSSNEIFDANGYFVTDHFAYSVGGFRIVKGNTNMGSLGTTSMGNCRLGLYDANKTFITAAYISHAPATNVGFTTDGEDLVCDSLASVQVFSSVDWTTVKYIRMTLALNNASSAIASVDAVMNSGIKIYKI